MSEKLNSKKEIKLFSCWTVISFGYAKEYMNWQNGHYTVTEHYYFLFWHIRIMYAIIKF
jgi:hypothetical protein